MKNYLTKIIMVLVVSLQCFAKTYEVGITQIVQHSVLDSVRTGFEKGLSDNGITANIDYENAQGDMVTQQMIAKNFNEKKKDLILSISTPSTQAVANAVKNTPILFGAATSPKEVGILNNPNVTGISDFIPPGGLLKITKQFFPSVKTIGIIYNSSEKNSEITLNRIKKEAEAVNLKIQAVGVTALNEVPLALDTILKSTDGIYLLPDNLVVSATPLILKNAEKKKIPVFSIGYDKTQIEMGVTLGISVDYSEIGYELGVIGSKILKGEPVKNFPYQTTSNLSIIVNDSVFSKYTTSTKEEIENFSKNIKN